jgi:hypothetical protein
VILLLLLTSGGLIGFIMCKKRKNPSERTFASLKSGSNFA